MEWRRGGREREKGEGPFLLKFPIPSELMMQENKNERKKEGKKEEKVCVGYL